MRKILLLAIPLLLMVSCHKKDKQQTTDSVPTPADTSVVIVDTTSFFPTDTAQQTAKPSQAQLQKDSAEITHLKIFARKQQTIYAPSLLVGEWIRGTEHEEYFANGT